MIYYILAIFFTILIIFLVYYFSKSSPKSSSKFSAPNFFVRYKTQGNNYTSWTGKISSDGNTLNWTSPGGSKGIWTRASLLTSDQDPTIISGGEVNMSNLPPDYTNMPATGIETYNWLNIGAKWPILIIPYSKDTPNMYYMKQGTHYDPNIDVLIAS